jgi:hypothetical protein
VAKIKTGESLKDEDGTIIAHDYVSCDGPTVYDGDLPHDSRYVVGGEPKSVKRGIQNRG